MAITSSPSMTIRATAVDALKEDLKEVLEKHRQRVATPTRFVRLKKKTYFFKDPRGSQAAFREKKWENGWP